MRLFSTDILGRSNSYAHLVADHSSRFWKRKEKMEKGRTTYCDDSIHQIV